MNYIEKLKSDLQDCAADGIISGGQAAAIAARIQEKQDKARIKGTAWMAIIAGSCLALGIIMIISHNWDKIPAAGKIFGFLALYAAVGESALFLKGKALGVSAAPFVLWFFMPIIGIGLYAQIFQLSGDPLKPVLVWAVLSYPLALLAESKHIPLLQTLLLAYILIAGGLMEKNFLTLNTAWGAGPEGWLAAALVIGAGWYLARTKMPGKQGRLAALPLIWLMGIVAAGTVFQCKNTWLLFFAAAALSVVWINAAAAFDDDSERYPMPVLVWFGLFYGLSFFYKEGHRITDFSSGQAAPAGAAAIGLYYSAAVAFTLLQKKRLLSQNMGWERGARVFLILALTCAGLFNGRELGLMANLFFCAASVALMWHGTISGSVKHINIGVATMLLILVTRFIDFFGTYLESGAAFIAAGFMFAGLAYTMQKGRKALIARAGAGEK